VENNLIPAHLLRRRFDLQGELSQRPHSAPASAVDGGGGGEEARQRAGGAGPAPARELTREAVRLQAIASAAAAAARAEEQRRQLGAGARRSQGGALPAGAAAGAAAPRLPPRPDPLSTRRPTAALLMRRRAEAAAAAPPHQQAHQQHHGPRHVKTNYVCTTSDGWRLHLVRTQRIEPSAAHHQQQQHQHQGPPPPPAPAAALAAAAATAATGPHAPLGPLLSPPPPRRHHPVVLVPGLGSSGAYCFDLSPGVSLPDHLAARGWDVWTVELRGNGASDKPALLSGRSRWWTVDTHVERDLPALLRFVTRACGRKRAHVLGHSMGGMALCGLMARADNRGAARVRSVCSVGSGLFLEDSDWRALAPMLPLSRVIPWTVPSGALLRAYGSVMFTPRGAPPLDALYFVGSNVDHGLARAMMRRNWSDLSVGVVRQVASAFGPRGLLSADGRTAYGDPSALGRVAAPALFICGDEDRMCPPGGARRTADLWGAALVAEHYGRQQQQQQQQFQHQHDPQHQQHLQQQQRQRGDWGGSKASLGGAGGERGERAQCPQGAAGGGGGGGNGGAGPCPYGARFVLCGPGSRVPDRRPASAPARTSGGGGGGSGGGGGAMTVDDGALQQQQQQQRQHWQQQQHQQQQQQQQQHWQQQQQHEGAPPPPPPAAAARSRCFRDHYGHFDILMGLRVETEVFPAIAQFFEDHDAPGMPSLMLETPPLSPRL